MARSCLPPKRRSEDLSLTGRPLYVQGKELRLKQQHFFVSGTLQDVIRRYKEKHDDFKMFPEKVGIAFWLYSAVFALSSLSVSTCEVRYIMNFVVIATTHAFDCHPEPS